MVELTVGYVAGFIAFAIFIAQVWLPTALGYVLAGQLNDQESAATWTVAARVLQSTFWPVVLRSDSGRYHGVRWPIRIASHMVPGIAVLIGIAGVITPLGLYDAFEETGDRLASFIPMKDTISPFGFATSPRGNHSFSRSCTSGHGLALAGPIPCPYSNNVVVKSWNGSTLSWAMPGGYWTSIPDIVRDIYSSGTSSAKTTISNFFDIEWRQLTYRTYKYQNEGAPTSIGIFRQVDSLVMEKSIHVIEGLVVDGIGGGVGFRNHTIPTGVANGAGWSEDLLFVEPFTSCIDTNLTFEFKFTTNQTASTYGITDIVLIDNGGFVNLNRTYPYYDRSNPQVNPDLIGRAYKAAWLNNAYSMMFLNVTNPNNSTYGAKAFSYLKSTLGQRFPLPGGIANEFMNMGFSSKYGAYLFSSGIGSKDDPKYPNPFNVTQDGFFADAALLCAGAGNADISNITNIFVGCGLLRSVPRRIDGGPQALFEDGSRWQSSLHSCASAVRAKIKTASFALNATDGVPKLVVSTIRDKLYARKEDEPLWAVEDSGLDMDGINPIWGLVSPSYKGFPNVSYVQQPALHLVGYSGTLAGSLSIGSQLENIPGSSFPIYAMNSVFSGTGVTSQNWPFDLMGRASMSTFVRWQGLSKDAASSGIIINLMWTDLAASAVVGTKGTLGRYNAGRDNETVPIVIRPFEHRVKYNIAFGVPSFILLCVMLVVTGLAFSAAVTDRASLAIMRVRLQQTSVGRVLTSLLYPNESTVDMPSKDWSLLNGEKPIAFGEVVAPHEYAAGAGGELGYAHANSPLMSEGGVKYGGDATASERTDVTPESR